MDLKSGAILDTTASRAYGALEREAALALVDNVAKVHGGRVALRYLLMDANDTSAAFLADVLARGLEPVVPTKTLSKAAIPGPLRKRVIPVELARSHRRHVRAALAAQHVRNRTRPPQLARAGTRVERLFAEAKESHGLHRARGIRLQMMNIQALLTATAQNLRRLAKTYRIAGAGEARLPSASLARPYHWLHSLLAQVARSITRPTFSLNF